MGYNLLINGVYWGFNPLTNLLLTSWDIQVVAYFPLTCQLLQPTLPETKSNFAPENGWDWSSNFHLVVFGNGLFLDGLRR